MWFDVGSPQELIRAQNTLIERRNELPFPLQEGARIENGSFIDPDASVHERSHVQQSVVGRHASVAEGAVLNQCVLMSGSVVGEGVQLQNCILSPNAVVKSNVYASGVVLGDGEHLENTTNTENEGIDF